MALTGFQRRQQFTSNLVNSRNATGYGLTNQNLDPITYNPRYPGFDEANYRKLESKIDALGYTGYEKEKAMDDLYIQVLPQVQDEIKNSDRRKYINQTKYEASQIQDKNSQLIANSKIAVTELAQQLKEKFNIDPSANDEEVFNSWMESIPNSGYLLTRYLNSGDKELLYRGGLETNPIVGQDKLKNNFWNEVWDNVRTKANIPVDNLKKWGQRTMNELGAKVYKDVLKNTIGDTFDGVPLDNLIDNITDTIVRQEVMDYQQDINERYREKELENLDQDVANYYNNKGYTKLLTEGDWKGLLYKSMGDAAQNREMPVVVAASVFQPEVGLALMATDSYARENQEAFENMLDNGATYEEAEKGAVVVGLVNAAVELTLEKLLGGVETTASKNIRKIMMKNVQEEATKKGLGRLLLEGVGTQLRASGEEGLEEIVQQIVQNAAVKTVNENQELFEGVGEAFEGGFYNPMNLLAGGGNLTQNINQNVDMNEVRQSIMNGAYKAGVGARAITDRTGSLLDAMKNRLNRKANVETQTVDNVEVETTENTEKSGLIDRVTDWGAEKLTNTVSAQDKLYKAQEPRMNTLTRKKDLEKRRERSDRANQLIVENGYIPTNTAERLEAHETTMKNIWKQVEDRINGGQEIMVDLSQIADVLDEYIQSQRDTKSTLTEGDLAKLEKESQALRGQQVSLPVAERLKQLYNAVINNRGEEKASDTMANGLQKATHEIGVIEDNLLSEIPGEFQGLKNDFGALKDTYEDVFKADMKNQRKKGAGLTETYSRIEGIGDIANGLLGVATGKGDLASIGKGAAKFLVGKSLAKASDVDFLIEQGFKELAKQYGNNGNVTTNTTPTTPTATAPTTRTTTEITEDIDVGENPTDLTATEEVVETTKDVNNETPQIDWRFEEDLEEENLRELEDNETSQRDEVNNKQYNSIDSVLKDYVGKELYDGKRKIEILDNDQAIYAKNIDGPQGTNLDSQYLISLREFNELLDNQDKYKAEYGKAMQDERENMKKQEEQAVEEENIELNKYLAKMDNPQQKGKVKKVLSERTLWKLPDGKIKNWTKAQWIEYLVKEKNQIPKEFPTKKTYPNGEPKVEYMIVNDKNVGYKSSKIENDYARSLLEVEEEQISKEDEEFLEKNLFNKKS